MLTGHIDRELDTARNEGPVRTIVIPPCPELLTRLQVVMAESGPDWDTICSIAMPTWPWRPRWWKRGRARIAACTIAEHIVDGHEGRPGTPEWIQRGHTCLQHLQVHEDELVLWRDCLQPALDHIQ